MPARPVFLALIVTLASPAAGVAQDFSDAELRSLFERQRETFRQAREAELGAARGLVLAPADQPAAEAVAIDQVAVEPIVVAPRPAVPAAAELAPPAVAPDTGAAPPGRATPALDLAATESAEAPAQPLQYWILPAAQQVNMRVTFAFDSAAIAESEKPKLRQICAVIDEAGINQFRIIGHTDATGAPAYNQRLSVRRAEEVRRFFMDDCGIAAERLEAIGVGKQFPANAADPFAGENRRVEFQAMS
jgi:OmpA-OmpF porin, OOP family